MRIRLEMTPGEIALTCKALDAWIKDGAHEDDKTMVINLADYLESEAEYAFDNQKAPS